jgi:hypothetical protein
MFRLIIYVRLGKIYYIARLIIVNATQRATDLTYQGADHVINTRDSAGYALACLHALGAKPNAFTGVM